MRQNLELRHLLLRDFGVDLPIAGGSGKSADDPIQITNPDPTSAALAQLNVMRCIYRANGWYWRVTGRKALDSNTARIEKLSTEVKYIEEDNVITEKRNLYFDLVNITADQSMPETRIFVGQSHEFSLPWEIGWFHYDGLKDFEIDNPGLGTAVLYSAPMAKMTIYCYNNGRGEEIRFNPYESSRLEFLQAISEIKSIYPHAQLIQEHEKAGVHLNIFEYENNWSAVMLAPFNDFFFKLRLTLSEINEPFMVACALQTIASFETMAVKGSQPN